MTASHSHETRRDHLKRLATIVAGAVGASACAPGAGPGGTAPGPLPAGRRVRIGLAVGAGSVRIGSQGDVLATEGGQAAIHLGSGEAVDVTPSGDGLSASGGGQSARFDSLVFRGSRGLVTVDGIPYRGTVSVVQQSGAVTVVNELGLEEYVAGVIAVEMGRRSGSERAALEAQAIASRTYAVANLGRFRAQGFDLRAGVSDQAYRGAEPESDEGSRAVRDTAGLVLTLDGRPVTAFFHSTCGFATASPEESFRNVRPQEYLRSVSDAHSRGYYCEGSPRFRWQVEWSGAELTAVLRRTVPRVLGIDEHFVSEVRDLEVRGTGASGRATEIRVQVDQGEIPVFGPDVRAVFQTPEADSLGSTAVQLTKERANDRLTRLIAAGAGWGHGVGMCQWGAIGRARAGQDYQTILRTYFPGTTVTRWTE
jgi:stage II sporulation protein D